MGDTNKHFVLCCPNSATVQAVATACTITTAKYNKHITSIIAKSFYKLHTEENGQTI